MALVVLFFFFLSFPPTFRIKYNFDRSGGKPRYNIILEETDVRAKRTRSRPVAITLRG